MNKKNIIEFTKSMKIIDYIFTNQNKKTVNSPPESLDANKSYLTFYEKGLSKLGNKQHIDIVFVVLVYRNTKDVLDLLQSISSNVDSYKVIIVNSFYDQKSKNIIKTIAIKNSCIFLNIDNRGYGYGNNHGIKYAIKHFNFRCIIVANPDTKIIKFNLSSDDLNSDKLICPIIKTLDNRNQNPYIPIQNKLYEYLLYTGYKYNLTPLKIIGIATNKIIREIFLRCYFIPFKNDATIYAAHGSFLIFTSNVIKIIGYPFDEKMFLFSEEMYLAKKLNIKNIKISMNKNIEIAHKEDGSMKMSKDNYAPEHRKSYLYYYSIRNKIR